MTKSSQTSKVRYCSPERHSIGLQDKTCMTVNELQSIAKDYNNNFVEKYGQIATNATRKTPKRIPISNNKRDMLASISKELGGSCGQADHCWVQQDFVSPQVRDRILDKAFRPLKPKEWYLNRNTWLNTYDILKVMKQYERLYTDFFFLGVFPIDFGSKTESGQCIAYGMCEFDIRKLLQKGKIRFGMVLNLDRHDQSGSHWVSVYCNLNNKKTNFGIYYYDSVAHQPPKEVGAFMKEINRQVYEVFSKRVADRFAMRYNRIQKQFDNYDCGVFSEVFLTQILKNIKFDDICKKMKTDKEINRLRDVLYTPSKVNKV